MERWLRRYWGYPLLALFILTWIVFVSGGIPREVAVAFLVSFSVADAYYFSFRVPLWCGAVNRDGTLCRDNSTGFLWGCHRRQHKWQRLKMLVIRARWRQLYRELFGSAPQGFATVLGTVTILSSVITSSVAVTGIILKIH